MKRKKLLSALLAAVLLLLCACSQENNGQPTVEFNPPSSQPSSTPTVPSIVPTVPTTVPTVPATVPTVPTTAPPQPATTQLMYSPTGETSLTPNSTMGDPHIHYDYIGVSFAKYDCSDCVTGYLYWVNKGNYALTLLLAEQVAIACENGPYIFYVKTAEPTKVYRMLIGDPSQSELIYESTGGQIGYMCFYPYVMNYLQVVEEEKRLVVMDLNTGEKATMLELPYITHGNIGPKEEGVLSDWVWFEGQISEDRYYIQYYFYNRITGEFVEDNDCCD